MVDARLVEYVSDLLKKGYSAQTIHDQLVSHGYDEQTPHAAIKQSGAGFFHFSPLLFLSLLGALSLLGVVVIAIITLNSPDANITLALTPDPTALSTGDTL